MKLSWNCCDVKGNLFCIFNVISGQDSISLAKNGATVTGADLSDAAVEKQITGKRNSNVNADFICCNIYNLPDLPG